MKKVTLFIFSHISPKVLAVIGAVLLSASIAGVPHVAKACSYDGFGCGSYGYSNYGNYYNYWPFYSSSVGCGQFCGGNFGGFGGFNYVPSQQYSYVYNQPTYRPQNQYQYVQYPYYQYTYFQNPAPQGSSDIFNYVQYPYQFYVQYR